MSYSVDQVESWNAVIAMWMRRVRRHAMLEPAVTKFLLDLARLDKELKGKRGTNEATFEEDLDRLLKEQEKAIRSGRKAG